VGEVTGDSLLAAVLPSTEHLSFNFTGMKHFSLIYLTSAYYQILVSTKRSKITAFCTHTCLYTGKTAKYWSSSQSIMKKLRPPGKSGHDMVSCAFRILNRYVFPTASFVG